MMTSRTKKASTAKSAPAGNQSTKPAERRKATTEPVGRSGSKQSTVIAMLAKPAGTTIPAIMKSTGWQAHSVRGFLAGVIRKKLGLKLESAEVNGKRIYRIVSGAKPAQKAAAAQ